MQGHLFFIVLFLFVAAVASYSCDPSKCKPPSCRCASTSPPTRLDGTPIPLEEIPQFVSITWDDSVNYNSCWDYLQSATLALTAQDSRGCTPRATFYVSTWWTNYTLVQQLYAAGHEIAIHTVTHTTSTSTSEENWADEVHSSRLSTSTLAQVPMNKMIGMRAPFLQYNDGMFDAIYNEGLLFDSSIEDQYGAGLSSVGAGLTWPYTFDYGTPQNPDTGELPAKNYPGLWEVPMACLHSADNTAFASMDPAATGSDLLTLLKRNFDQHYTTNRSPFGLYTHAALWIAPDPTRAQVVAQFYDYVATKSNVVFATAGQIVKWMQNPVPASEISSIPAFKCPKPPTQAKPEVCNGIDDDLDGVVDDGVIKNCAYEEDQVWFSTCASKCPTNSPQLGCTYAGYYEDDEDDSSTSSTDTSSDGGSPPVSSSSGSTSLDPEPVTTAKVTTKSLTTKPLTTKSLTTQPLTTQPQPLTTKSLTTAALTTSTSGSGSISTSSSATSSPTSTSGDDGTESGDSTTSTATSGSFDPCDAEDSRPTECPCSLDRECESNLCVAQTCTDGSANFESSAGVIGISFVLVACLALLYL